MNIFVLDHDLRKCAEYTCDKHVVKMILEHAQMLSMACRLRGYDCGYKLIDRHKNHPCTKWVCESIANWLWLRELTKELNEEYKFRYNHTNNHKSYDVVRELEVPYTNDDYDVITRTPFAQAMPDDVKNTNPVVAYRDYYVQYKQELLQWTKRPTPLWVTTRLLFKCSQP